MTEAELCSRDPSNIKSRDAILNWKELVLYLDSNLDHDWFECQGSDPKQGWIHHVI